MQKGMKEDPKRGSPATLAHQRGFKGKGSGCRATEEKRRRAQEGTVQEMERKFLRNPIL